MANLGTWTINTNGEYKKLSTLTNLTFTGGETYTIQIYNPAFVREGTTGKGFYIFDDKPFQFIAGSDDLYVKSKYGACEINIAN